MERTKTLYALVILWLLLSLMFIAWGWYSLDYALLIISWPHTEPEYELFSFLFFSNILYFVSWWVFAVLFILFAFGTYTFRKWIWTTGVIVNSIFIVIFALMLASFMTTAIFFMD